MLRRLNIAIVGIILSAMLALVFSSASLAAQHQSGVMVGQMAPMLMLVQDAASPARPIGAHGTIQCQAHPACASLNLALPGHSTLVLEVFPNTDAQPGHPRFSSADIEVLLPPPLFSV